MFLKIKKIPKVHWSSEKPYNFKPKFSTFFFLCFGLTLFGLGEGLLIVSFTGASPWSVLAQGISLNVNLSIGTITLLVSIAVLILWIPLGQRPGMGTIFNALIIALMIDLCIKFVPTPSNYIYQLILAVVSVILVGVGGGIYLAEYSKGGPFSRFIRFGVNVLAGVPSIIAGVFIYALIVSTKILFGSMYSGLAGGMALSILMLPTVIKTTDEGLKLVPNELRYASLGVGASMYTTILKITLPSAFRSISTGIVLGIARAAGETAPLIFTALFSYYYITGFGDLFYEMGSLAVLIYNFALEPYDAQNKLAWAASFILVLSILSVNIFSRILAVFTEKTKRV